LLSNRAARFGRGARFAFFATFARFGLGRGFGLALRFGTRRFDACLRRRRDFIERTLYCGSPGGGK
jgi:hypothetical protein